MTNRKDAPPAPDPRERPNRAPSNPALACAGAGEKQAIVQALGRLVLTGVIQPVRVIDSERVEIAVDAKIVSRARLNGGAP